METLARERHNVCSTDATVWGVLAWAANMAAATRWALCIVRPNRAMRCRAAACWGYFDSAAGGHLGPQPTESLGTVVQEPQLHRRCLRE